MRKIMLYAYPYKEESLDEKGKKVETILYSYEPVEGVKPIKVAVYRSTKLSYDHE